MTVVPAQALGYVVWKKTDNCPVGVAMRTSVLMGDPRRSVKTRAFVGALTVALLIGLSLTIAFVSDSVPTSDVAGEDDGPYTQVQLAEADEYHPET